jgi:hypothetical protein
MESQGTAISMTYPAGVNFTALSQGQFQESSII